MNIVEVRIEQETDRGVKVVNERYITEVSDYEAIRVLVLTNLGMESLDDFDKFGRKVTDLSIEEFTEELYPLGN